MSTTGKSYPSDVTDVEWEFLLPYLTLMREDAPQREYALRELFNAMRYVVKTGCQWRFLPHDLPPWQAELFEQIGRLKMELEWVKKKLPPSCDWRRQQIESGHVELSVR